MCAGAAERGSGWFRAMHASRADVVCFRGRVNVPNVNKGFWKLKIPLKIKKFLWYLKRGVILTKDNLKTKLAKQSTVLSLS